MKTKTLNIIMEENDMIEVVGQLGSDTETILKASETGTIVYKHVACQTASAASSEVLVPIMFCTLFSPICEASLQVNLPITSSMTSSSPTSVIPPAGAENREIEHKSLDHIKSIKRKKRLSFAAETREIEHKPLDHIKSAKRMKWSSFGPENRVFEHKPFDRIKSVKEKKLLSFGAEKREIEQKPLDHIKFVKRKKRFCNIRTYGKGKFETDCAHSVNHGRGRCETDSAHSNSHGKERCETDSAHTDNQGKGGCETDSAQSDSQGRERCESNSANFNSQGKRCETDCARTDSHGKGCETDSAHSDSQEPDDDDVFLSPSPEEDCVEEDTEDSEYSSDNDLAFWEEMKRHAKRKSKNTPRNKLSQKCPSQKGNLRNIKTQYSSRNFPIPMQRYSDQQSPLTKEDNKTSDEASAVIGPENGDDWITDDEMDDEGQVDIDLAFKREWKEKRLPHNSKEKNFICEICGKQYSKHSYLRRHVVRDHKDHEEAKKYPYSCEHCKKVYVRERQLLTHRQQLGGPCEICGIVLKCSGLFWTHRRNHDSICEVCNRVFQSRTALYWHMRMKHSNKTVSCSECDRKFPFEFLKNKHIAKAHHNAEQARYRCDKCDFWSAAKVALKIHQTRMHKSKFDKYTCKECNTIFDCRLTYNNHVASHVSKSSIVCPSCSQEFISEYELRAHKLSTHEVTDIRNSGKKTTSGHFNNTHVLQYLCALCNMTLGDSENLAQHIQKYHDMDVDAPRDIKLQVETGHIPETDGYIRSIVGDKETNPQAVGGQTIKNETAVVSISADGDYSSAGSALVMLASAVPPNVNMVESNGVQYHVIRRSK